MPSIAPDRPAAAVTSVAVAVIENRAGEVLLSQRPNHVHLGGCWEFPGGKVEPGETALMALVREVREELGLQVLQADPMLQIPWAYPEKVVRLHVWRVTAFDGVPVGREQQRVQWVPRSQLSNYTFPPANQAILTALHLPHAMLVTGAFSSSRDCLDRIQRAVEQHGIRCVQLRAPDLSQQAFQAVAWDVAHYCRQHQVCLLLNTTPDLPADLLNAVSGVHLNTARLMQCRQRPVSPTRLLGASCHSAAELQHALSLPVDYVLVSPVLPTASHPDTAPLGWAAFEALVKQSSVPVLALGGVSAADLTRVRAVGAYGIAGISAWW